MRNRNRLVSPALIMHALQRVTLPTCTDTEVYPGLTVSNSTTPSSFTLRLSLTSSGLVESNNSTTASRIGALSASYTRTCTRADCSAVAVRFEGTGAGGGCVAFRFVSLSASAGAFVGGSRATVVSRAALRRSVLSGGVRVCRYTIATPHNTRDTSHHFLTTS